MFIVPFLILGYTFFWIVRGLIQKDNGARLTVCAFCWIFFFGTPFIFFKFDHRQQSAVPEMIQAGIFLFIVIGIYLALTSKKARLRFRPPNRIDDC